MSAENSNTIVDCHSRESGNPLLPILILLLIFLLSISVNAAIEITAEVDNLTPTVGERITYTITVSGRMPLPDATRPSFEGLKVVMGPEFKSNVDILNFYESRSWTYILRALRPGRITIEPVIIKQKRKIYKSNSIDLEVLAPGSPPTALSDKHISEDASEPAPARGSKLPDVFITARADKDTVHKLEMVTVTYRLYFCVNVTGYEFAKQPQARGFWQEEFSVPKRPQLKNVTVRGKQFKVAVIRKIGLFPTRTGELTVDPLVIDCQVEVPSKRRSRHRDPFDDFFSDSFFSRTRREVKSLATEPLKLTVLDLPMKGQPPNFRGDVGEFRLDVRYDKQILAQHDALTIKVTFRGDGYIKSIDPPKLNLPSSFEQFDPTVDESVTTSGQQVKGRKTFTYLVIPRVPGNYDLRPISFCFFNPSTGRYHVLREGGAELTVTTAEGEVPTGDWIARSDVTLLDSDIRFIKGMKSPLRTTVKPPYNSIWFYIAMCGFPFLYLFGLGTETIIVQRMSDPDTVRRRRAPDQMRKQLKEAKKAVKQGSTGLAIDTAGRGLADFAGAIVGISAAGLTLDILKDQLIDTGAEMDLIDEVMTLLQETDCIRFSSAIVEKQTAEELLERFHKVAERLERVR